MYRLRVTLASLALLLTLVPPVLAANTAVVAAASTGVQGTGATFFLISSSGTHMCADVKGASQAPLTPVILYACNYNGNEQFTWRSDGTIRAFAGSNLCLDDSGARGNNGDPVIIYTCNGGVSQRWAPTANGSIQGVNGKCIDIYHAANVNLTPIILWPCSGAANQRWNAVIRSSTAPPPPVVSGIPIQPGNNIQRVVNAYPPGTAFVLNRGTYYGQSVVPKSGDVFQGEPGAVLDGRSAPYAFSKGNPPYPSNVTIRGLKITNYNPPTQHAAVDAGDSSVANLTSGWIIARNEVGYNNEYGIRTGSNTQVTNNVVHHNKRLDITGQGSNILVAGNEISFGNYLYTSSLDYEAGGTKFVNTNGLTVRNNYVHDNLGGALWLDSNNINSLIEDNNVVNNSDDGISTEVSYAAVIRYNTVKSNGWHDPLARYSFLWNAGIAVHASANVAIYGNTVSGNFAGIVAVQQDRSATNPPLYGPHLVQNLYVHDNVITQTNAPAGIYKTSVAAGIAEDTGDTRVLTSWNNRFVNNTYYLGTDPSPFCWGNYMNVAGWQQNGQDLTGTFHR